MKKRELSRKLTAWLMTAAMAGISMAGCSSETKETTKTESAVETTKTESAEETEEGMETELLEKAELQVFIAASLSGAMEEIAQAYQEIQPNIEIVYNADSSGTLLTQIEEGYECDIFFSAAVKQMDQLEEDGLVVEGTRTDLLKNQVCLITGKESQTQVTGFADMELAKSMALAAGSVPVGRYTRVLLMNLGILPETEEPAEVTSLEISEALSGLEINECSNVSKVKEAVKEGANEIGTVYYSDAYSVRDDVIILEMADTKLTGEIVYPVARVVNEEAEEAQQTAAEDFLRYLQGEEALEIFADYMFLVD